MSTSAHRSPTSLAIAVVIALVGISTTGYGRRRAIWPRAAWIRFGTCLGAAAGTLGVGFLMAWGVDLGAYHRLPYMLGRLYAGVLAVALAAGFVGTLGLLLWFAYSRPDRLPWGTPR